MDDFLKTTAIEVAAGVRERTTTAREQTERALELIAQKNDTIGAFVAVDGDRALAEADAVDTRVAAGDELPLAGVPIGVKDLEDAVGYTTTHGSRLHVDDAPAVHDSALVERLRAAGCVVVGKTNTPEFGSLGDTVNDVFPFTRNPHNTDRSAGGSSGGSAAAISSGMVPLATGSDGGGSIRIPSALNGITGFKPSKGRVPFHEPEMTAWLHYSTPGPMAKRIDDIVAALDVAVGPDPTDLHSLPRPRGESWSDALTDPGLPRAVLWSPNLGYAVNDTEVESVCRAAVDKIAAAGTEVIEIDTVWDEDPVRDWAALAFLGLKHKLLSYGDRIELARPSTRMLAGLVDGADEFSVFNAIRAGHRLNYRLVELFHRAPILLCPATAGQPGAPDEQGTINGEQSVGWVTYTPPFNMTGNPAGTVNAGTTADGMPVGLQVVGTQHADIAVLRALSALEPLLS